MAVVLAGAGILAALTATASPASPQAANCSFTLRIGTVLPFTGGLAAYGGNMDKAVRLAIQLQNAALKKAGLSKKIKVVLVDSQDGQTQAAASVEAAKKEVGEHVDVIIGEMASGATIPMAQSVTIPNHIVLISPTASAPEISTLADNGYVWRAYPSDTLQGKVLAQAALEKFGKGATINVGARNDAFGTALEQLFVAQWKAVGGKVGVNIAWNPDQATFDTEAGQLVSGNPAGWVIIDFPQTFVKFVPSLVRHRPRRSRATSSRSPVRLGQRSPSCSSGRRSRCCGSTRTSITRVRSVQSTSTPTATSALPCTRSGSTTAAASSRR